MRTPSAKLQPPAPPSVHLQRPGLVLRLDAALTRRLTTVVAGPGFGKSTLLAGWARGRACAWYTLDGSDASLAVLVRGLVDAFRERLPDLSELATRLGRSPAAASDEHARAEALAARVCEWIDGSLGSGFVLVLDDLQELVGGTPSARLIETLCRQGPPELHHVIASRTELPFPVERLRGRGEVLAIDAANLAFSGPEVGELLESELGSGSGSGSIAAAVYELTAGWPAAVRLAVEALRGTQPARRQSVLRGLSRPGGLIFNYLAEEALAGEEPDVRDLLRAVAHLDRFTSELCSELGMRAAAETLPLLAGRGLLVQAESGDEPWFALHGLVRDFATERWPLSAVELSAQQRKAARWFEARGDLHSALRAATASADGEELGRLLMGHGDELLTGGALDGIQDAAAFLPPEARSEQLEEIFGEAHALKGEWDEALACYRRAAGEEASLPPGLAWRIGRIHFDRGAPERALDAYARGRPATGDAAAEALLLAGAASAHLSVGDLDAAARAAADALTRAEESGNHRALAAAHNVSMVLALRLDPARTAEHYRSGLDASERANDVIQTIRIRCNHVAHLIQQGSLEEALAELEIAVSLGDVAGAPLTTAFALLKRGEIRSVLGEFELAMADFVAARRLYERNGSSRVFGAMMEIGELYRERGEASLARVVLEEALRGAEDAGDVQVVSYGLANLARVLAAEDPARAAIVADRACRLGRESGHGLVFAVLSSGWVALAAGDREAAAARAAESAALARERTDRGGLAEALELGAMSSSTAQARLSLLDEAIAIWRELRSRLGEARAALARARIGGDEQAGADAMRRLQRLGVRTGGASAGLIAALPAHDPAPVTVNALGRFRVLRAGDPVAPSEWRSRKARDVLKILVCHRGHSVTRDYLVEALWPEEDPAKTGNRLSVALSTVRAVLDPGHRLPPNHFLVAGERSVALDTAHVAVDVDDFLADAAEGLRQWRDAHEEEALERLEAAEIAYTGDFLEEDVYEDWSMALREEARAAYRAVAGALADLGTQSGRHDEAIRYRLRIVERDAYDEEAQLGLVCAFAAAGRHGEARRAYRVYAGRMEQIGVEPAPFPAAVASLSG